MLSHQFSATEIVILVAVTIGAITDLKTKKIYNWITLPAAMAGFAINVGQGFLQGGAVTAGQALLWSLAGCLLAVAITGGPNALTGKDMLHRGDVKIWAAIGACLLPAKLIICWFYFALAYGAITAVLIARAIRQDQIKGFGPVLKIFLAAASGRSSSSGATAVDAARKALIPVCPAIAAGCYLGIFFDRPLLHFMGFC